MPTKFGIKLLTRVKRIAGVKCYTDAIKGQPEDNCSKMFKDTKCGQFRFRTCTGTGALVTKN